MSIELVLGRVVRVARGFDYDTTRFDNGRKHGVYYGGTQPLKRGANGVLIGYVATLNDINGEEWFATADTGTAVSLRWTGGFRSRIEASLFLLGCRLERDWPALTFLADGTNRPISNLVRANIS